MAAVDAWTPTPLRSADMADPDTHTPHHNVRMADPKWAAFGDVAGKRGRSAWVNELVDAITDDPELWHDIRAIAAARNLPVDAVLNTALRQYRNRTRKPAPQRPDSTED